MDITLSHIDKCVIAQVTEKICPECGNMVKFEWSEDGYIICRVCGLVLAAVYPYVAEIRLDLPWGIL